MGKLNQVLAVVSRLKTNATDVVTRCYHIIQKSPRGAGRCGPGS